MSSIKLNRRELIGATLAAAILAPSAAMVAAYASGASVVAQKTSGQYKGVKYTLLVLQDPDSGDHLGNVVGTPDGTFESVNGRPIIRDVISSADAAALKPSANVLFASNTTNGGVFRGVQIQNGVLYQDFNDPWLNNIGRVWDAYGVDRSGVGAIYRYGRDSGAGMVAAGVQDTFTFGLALTENGAPLYWSQHADYERMLQERPTDALMVVSGRTILGDDAAGRTMLLVSEGKTGSSGLTMDEAADLALSLGFHDSVSLDSGGSAQLWIDGAMVMGSSDGKERPLPAWGYMENVNVVDVVHQDSHTMKDATLYTGEYEGAKFKLIVVQEPNSGNVLGKLYATDSLKLPEGGPARVITPGFTPAEFYQRAPQQLMFTSDVAGNAIMRGVQIQDGVLVKDFDANTPSIARAYQAIGFKYDGTSEIYTWNEDTGRQMIADGVRNSFSFTSALVKDGVVLQPDDNPEYVDTDTGTYDFNFVSARTVLGSSFDGMVMLLVVEGKSHKAGLTLNQTAKLAGDLGFHQAVNLDGGGSTQVLYEGKYLHPSSDNSGERTLSNVGFMNSVRITEERPWYIPDEPEVGEQPEEPVPSEEPSREPTEEPAPTEEPSPEPTEESAPTEEPSPEPTEEATPEPTTAEPTPEPTEEPKPTPEPTVEPAKPEPTTTVTPEAPIEIAKPESEPVTTSEPAQPTSSTTPTPVTTAETVAPAPVATQTPTITNQQQPAPTTGAQVKPEVRPSNTPAGNSATQSENFLTQAGEKHSATPGSTSSKSSSSAGSYLTQAFSSGAQTSPSSAPTALAETGASIKSFLAGATALITAGVATKLTAPKAEDRAESTEDTDLTASKEGETLQD